MLSLLRKIIPKPLLSFYHLALAKLAAFWYGFPSEKLVVIGVTGTNGKSTVVNLIATILEEAGHKVGLTSTINFRVAGADHLNNLKMTMPGRFRLQKWLYEMVRAGCRYAVIESSSEGVLQHRHLGIHYDVMVFTNLAPEHLERHHGFENYKQAKLQYFWRLEKLPHKVLGGQRISKVIVVNAESSYAEDFLNFKVDRKFGFSFPQKSARTFPDTKIICPKDVDITPDVTSFAIEDTMIKTPLLGPFNVENALAAIAVAQSQGISLEFCRNALGKVPQIPGRLEFIRAGQPFRVMIDYAPEPNSLSALYALILSWPQNRLLHVLGSTGGGRDRARRAVLGEMAGRRADVVIVTNEDPYDDDPQMIVDEIAAGAMSAGKILNKDLYKILDRREAIRFALQKAEVDDLVLLTGKGSEQAMVVGGGRLVVWDDRQVVREELKTLSLRGPKGRGNPAANGIAEQSSQ